MRTSTILCIFIIFGFFTMGCTAATAEPIEVSNGEDLREISNNLTQDYILVNDVDLSDEPFDPIGDTDEPFLGSIDGNGHVVNNLTVKNHVGGVVGVLGQNGSVENLGVEGANITGAASGVIVGLNLGGTVVQSYATGNVTGDQSYATGNATGDIAGGLIGYHHTGVLADSYAQVDTEGDTAGGIAGTVYREGVPGIRSGTEIVPDTVILNSYSAGSVRGEVTGGTIGMLTVKTSYPKLLLENIYWDVNVTGQVNGVGEVAGIDEKNLGRLENISEDELRLTEEQGEGLTTSNMTGEAAAKSLSGFDFAETWTTTDTYPKLAHRDTVVEEVEIEPRIVNDETRDDNDESNEDNDESNKDETMPGFGFGIPAIALLILMFRRVT